MKLVTQDVHFSELRERLARAIHERFVAQQTGTKPADDPAMRSWENLPDNYREDNLRQADDIPRKLALINCGFEPARPDNGPSTIEFTNEEIETLAEDEHNQWNDFKKAQGYSYAPGPKDDVAKTHPCLLPWSDLPETEKNKDRDTVKAIPEFMDSLGFRVFRIT